MHPIDFVHHNVFSGKVLDNFGKWVDRNELQKEEFSVVQNIFKGKIYNNENWINLKEIDENTIQLTKDISPEKEKRDASIKEKFLYFASTRLQFHKDENVSLDYKETFSAQKMLMNLKSKSIRISNDLLCKVDVSNVNKIPICIIEIEGRVDQSNAHLFENFLHKEIDEGEKRFILNFVKTDYISSAGWGIIAAISKSLKNYSGELCVCGLNKELNEIFRLLQFDSIIKKVTSIENALSLYATIEKDRTTTISGPEQTEPEISTISNLNIQENIKRVIQQYGPISLKDIKVILKKVEFGGARIGILNLYFILRRMNLHTVENRKRYYRSS